MTETTMIDSNTLTIILGILAPAITGLLAKFHIKATTLKHKFSQFKDLIVCIDETLEDEKVTPEELRRLVKLLKGLTK